MKVGDRVHILRAPPHLLHLSGMFGTITKIYNISWVCVRPDGYEEGSTYLLTPSEIRVLSSLEQLAEASRD